MGLGGRVRAVVLLFALLLVVEVLGVGLVVFRLRLGLLLLHRALLVLAGGLVSGSGVVVHDDGLIGFDVGGGSKEVQDSNGGRLQFRIRFIDVSSELVGPRPFRVSAAKAVTTCVLPSFLSFVLKRLLGFKTNRRGRSESR